MGILRAGHQAFPISTMTTTPAGIAHLLQHTRAKYLLVGVDPVSQALACAALRVPSIGGTIGDNVKAAPMPSFEELFTEAEYEREPVPQFIRDRLIHASYYLLLVRVPPRAMTDRVLILRLQVQPSSLNRLS